MEPTIYLFFAGNCLEAMTHYAEVLGGEITGIYQNKHAAPGDSMPGSDDMVMNMNMRLGNANIMASDNPPEWYTQPQGFSVSVTPASLADFDRIFAALSAEAQSISMAPAETFWAERFATFTDRFGTPWMLNYPGKNKME